MGWLSRRDIDELSRGGKGSLAGAIGVLSTLLFSFWVLGVGIAMATKGNSTACIAALRWSTLYVGLAFVVVSILGTCGMIHNVDGLKALYIVGLLFILLALIVLVIFNYVAVFGKYWNPISSCLRHKNTCDGIMSLTIVSPVQSGCCKPPSSCGFTYVNGTTWSPRTPGGAGGAPAPAPAAVTNDDDCSRWSNDERTLCFQCHSCKASVLGHIKTAWHPKGIYITFLLVLSVCLYCVQLDYLVESDDE